MGPSSSWCFDSGLISINQFGHSDRGSWLNCCFTALQHLRSLAQGCGGEIIRCRQFRVISRTNEDPRDSRALLTCPCTPLHFFAVFMNCSIPNMCTKVIWSALVYHSYLEYIYIYIYIGLGICSLSWEDSQDIGIAYVAEWLRNVNYCYFVEELAVFKVFNCPSTSHLLFDCFNRWMIWRLSWNLEYYI